PAIDAESVYHRRRDQAVLGAFGPIPGVVDDGAMAVLEPRQTLAAVTAHGPLITPSAGNARLPRLAPALWSSRKRLIPGPWSSRKRLIPSPVRAAGHRRCRNGARFRGSR